MTGASLGPRAQLLYHLLAGTPRTAEELVAIAVAHAESDEATAPIFGSSFKLALRSLVDGGPDEVSRLLGRLAEFGIVDSVELDGTILWRARSSAA